jgi:hypothetical protein
MESLEKKFWFDARTFDFILDLFIYFITFTFHEKEAKLKQCNQYFAQTKQTRAQEQT